MILRKNNKGSAAVEFAITLPLLLLILFGIIEFSVAFFDKAVITNASREGARVGILFSPTPATDNDITNIVNSYISNNLINFKSSVTATTTVTRTGYNTGDTITVTVSYPYNYLVLPGFVSSLTSTVTLTAATVMRME